MYLMTADKEPGSLLGYVNLECVSFTEVSDIGCISIKPQCRISPSFKIALEHVFKVKCIFKCFYESASASELVYFNATWNVP